MKVLKGILWAAALVLLPLILAALGLAAGAPLARCNSTVSLADQVLADSGTAPEKRSFPLKAFYAEGGSRDELLARARTIEERFRWGGAIFGAWCGLVVVVQIASLRRVPQRTTYEIDHGICVACARCFMSCPLERARRKKLAGK
jgi:NAD-dependent dihydropyrimidine dehydrogenase PreA subunit